MSKINFMFWNINQADLGNCVIDLAIENNINVLILAECYFNINNVLAQLNMQKKGYKEVFLVGACRGIKIISNLGYKAELYTDEARHTTVKFFNDSFSFLLVAVHLPSKLYKEDDDYYFINRALSVGIRNDEIKSKTSNIIIVGDFNQNPFEESMVSMNGIHAMLHKSIPLIERTYQGITLKKFYNPMLNLFKEANNSLGTYYYDASSHAANFHWNFFDQVIVSPELVEKFDLDELTIINATTKYSLLKNNMPNKVDYSDHLPIKFSIQEGVTK